MLAVPFRTQSENLNNLRHALQPQTVLVDATVPLAAAIGGRATRTLGVWQGSAAQQAEEMAPRGVTVVSALHTVSAAALSDPPIEMDEDVLMAGDDRKAKDDVAELIRRIPGLRPVDCGDLEIARILEQLTPLLISVNKRHKIKHSGIRITGLDSPFDRPALRRHGRRQAGARACSTRSAPTGSRWSRTPATTSPPSGCTSPPTPTSSPTGSRA